MKNNPSSIARSCIVLTVTLLLAGARCAGAADSANGDPAEPPSSTINGPLTSEEIARLRAAIALQQKQIEALQHMIDQQQLLLERAAETPRLPERRRELGNVASLAPMVPPTPTPPSAVPPPPQKTATATANPCEAPPDANAVPTYLRIGAACIVPVGFMDLTAVWRDKDAGSSIGTNFSSIPYNNVAAGKNSEFRFSTQNSRIGFRVDGDWKGAHFIGYNEFDFLGTSGATNLGVSNNAFVPRLRQFWVNVRKNNFEFLAGQSWTMLTPNRRGISPLPGDLFYSQVIDVNYMIGLTWARQGGVRVLYHPNEKVTMGLSFENPDQYIGGSAGSPTVALPSALASLAGSQLDNQTNVLSSPNLHPDIIAKIAFDPSSRFHGEVAGIERTFRVWNPATNQYSTKPGAGVSVGLNFELVKNVRLLTHNYWSDGGGRYLFGQAPDLVLHADGSISAVHAGGTVDGVEATVKNWLFYAYYGGIYTGKNVVIDTNGARVGYGYPGSPNSQNRAINEVTFGFNQTIWKNPKYGALNAMGQYQYTLRSPWSVAAGAPKSAHDNTIYFNFRYTLPGSMPSF